VPFASSWQRGNICAKDYTQYMDMRTGIGSTTNKIRNCDCKEDCFVKGNVEVRTEELQR
jgi:hypothetical protein